MASSVLVVSLRDLHQILTIIQSWVEDQGLVSISGLGTTSFVICVLEHCMLVTCPFLMTAPNIESYSPG